MRRTGARREAGGSWLLPVRVAAALTVVLVGGLLVLALAQRAPEARASLVPADLRGSAAVGAPQVHALGGHLVRTFRVGGRQRGYDYHRPAAIASTRLAPVIVVLHGFRRGPAWTESVTGFDEIGDATGSVVVYPAGIDAAWNAGSCCGTPAAQGIDDADFIHAVVADLATRMPVDLQRVMLVGYSNGGMLAYRIACADAAGIASMVLINASLESRDCHPAAPLSMLVLHSRGDLTVPFDGRSYSSLLHTGTQGVMGSLDPFVAVDHCQIVRVVQDGTWQNRIWRGCAQGTDVTLIVHPTLDHRWPSTTAGGKTVGALAWDQLGGRRAISPFAPPKVAVVG